MIYTALVLIRIYDLNSFQRKENIALMGLCKQVLFISKRF